MKRRIYLAAFAAAIALVVLAAVALASPPSGVTPTILARGTYDSFKVKSAPRSPVDFKAKAKSPVDIVVRTHDYAPGSSTGWHSHPGPVFITVLEGKVTFYESDDPTCTPTTVAAGSGFIDDGGDVHLVRNEGNVDTVVYVTSIVPHGAMRRIDEPAPGNCPF